MGASRQYRDVALFATKGTSNRIEETFNLGLIMLRVLSAILLLAASPAAAAVLTEETAGEFSGSFTTPTDFTGFSEIRGGSSGGTDLDYFVFDSLLPGTTALRFELMNTGQGSNMQIRLSSTPFSMEEWDWRISPLAPAQELYARLESPTDVFNFEVPLGFDGSIYGLVRLYGTNSETSYTITQTGASAVVPLPGTLVLMLTALGAFGAVRRLGLGQA